MIVSVSVLFPTALDQKFLTKGVAHYYLAHFRYAYLLMKLDKDVSCGGKLVDKLFRPLMMKTTSCRICLHFLSLKKQAIWKKLKSMWVIEWVIKIKTSDFETGLTF